MTDAFDAPVTQGKSKTLKERWYGFKNRHGLIVYGAFSRQQKKSPSSGNIHLARLKIIGQNVFTLGLINIKYRIDQEMGKKKKAKPFTVNHDSAINELIEKLAGVCKTCNIGYPTFPADLVYAMREELGLGGYNAQQRQVEPQYEQQFFDLLADSRAEGIVRMLLRHMGA